VAIRLKIPTSRQTGKPGRGWSFQDPLLRAALVVFLVLATVGGGFFTYYYVKFGRMIDQRFKGPVFGNSARIYAVARPVQVGEKIEAKDIALQLRRAGYDQGGKSPMGSYRLFEGGVEIKPGSDSYHSPESAIIRIQGGTVESITSKSGDLAAYELEPQMITSLFDAGDGPSGSWLTDEIPKLMVDAVLAMFRRFFQHGGVNFLRLAEATWIDVIHGRHEQGGSTITMQLSRKFFLIPEKTIKRKLSEMLIAVEMEQKLSKQQIFEFYANRVDLGQRGSFTINGFGQAAQAYFQQGSGAVAELSRHPAIFRPTGIPSGPSNAATWCWTPWWKPIP
jgi:penicillin-binding protein 1B